MVEEKPTASTAKVPSEKDLEEVAELMSVGKRHLICNEPEKALDYFVELCERLAEFYGQTADECADAYLHYGKTLLGLARQEIGVFWNAVKEAPVLQEEEETEEEGEDQGEVMETEAKSGDKDDEKNEQKQDTEDEESKETAEKKEGEEQNDDDCGDQDVSHMELAWEMLELTCSICSRMVTEKRDIEKAEGMLAEAKYGLAQISMEQEQYERAIEDFNSCLEHYTKTLDDKLDRRIAEIHYNVGLAFSFDKKFEEAVTSFKEAKSLLESRLDVLKGKIEKHERESGKGKAPTELLDWNKEMKELEDLVLLDMNAKIEDAEESKKQADAELVAMKEKTKDLFGALSSATGFETGFGFDESTPTTEVKVHDATTNVRKGSVKRPSDDEGVSDAKKAKTVDQNSNNETATAGEKTNGVAHNDEKPTSVGA
ncbi:protein HGV2-like isoform X3 [Clytia hemisphaerica]|uniref:protein HGV2-like isoform X3 n=1 Tax=Clytia hemisphaerica TaxID=252671 RepID=UPI0034D48174